MSHRMYNVFVRPAAEVAKRLAGVVMLRPGASRGEVESAMVSLPMPLYVPRGADRMRWSGAKLVITTAEGDEVTASPGLALPRTMRAMLHGRNESTDNSVARIAGRVLSAYDDASWETDPDQINGLVSNGLTRIEAEVVAANLIHKGIDPSRVSTSYDGEDGWVWLLIGKGR